MDQLDHSVLCACSVFLRSALLEYVTGKIEELWSIVGGYTGAVDESRDCIDAGRGRFFGS